jgi:hypothetical protein
LIAQIGAGQSDHANQRALLVYLEQEAAGLHPLLVPLYQRFGISSDRSLAASP